MKKLAAIWLLLVAITTIFLGIVFPFFGVVLLGIVAIGMTAWAIDEFFFPYN